MKTLSLLSVGLLITTSAMAAKVGDKAEYEGTIAAGGNSYPAALVLEITGLGSKPDTFVVKTTVSVATQSQSNTAERTANEVGDEAQAAAVVANCADAKGTPETIALANGEKIETCKISGAQNGAIMTVNYAAVPFLTARMVTNKSGQVTTLTLKSYARGQ